MVLKYSNNRLNSGATMRRHAAVKPFRGYYSNVPLPETISIELRGHQSSSDDNAIFQDTLDMIYDYLDFEGPNISSYYADDGTPKQQGFFNVYPYDDSAAEISLEEKAKKLAKANILEPSSDTIEVQINVNSFFMGTVCNNNKRIFTWKSSHKCGSKCNTRQARKLKRKLRINKNKRGLQHCNENTQDQNYQNSPNYVPKGITINIQTSHISDARVMTKPWLSKDITNSNISYFKQKGFVNGIKSDFKGFNNHLLKRDLIEAIDDSVYSDEWPHEYDVSCEDYTFFNEQIEDHSTPILESTITFPTVFCLEDYIVHPFENSHEQQSYEKKTNLIKTNPASSELIEKHSKGSWILMTENTPEHHDFDLDSGIDSATGSTSGDTREEDSQEDSFGEPEEKVDHFFDLQGSVSHFLASFMQVELVLPQEFEILKLSSFHDSKYQTKDFKQGQCTLTFANCYPPTFVSKLNDKQNYHHNWYLIGRAAKQSQEKQWTWQIHLGNDNMSSEDKIIKDTFCNTFQEFVLCEISLQNLVAIFQDTIEKHTDNESKQAQNFTKPKYSSKYCPWRNLTYIVNECSKLYSVEDAFNIISKSSQEDYSYNISEVKEDSYIAWHLEDIEDEAEPIFCEICYLPCSYSEHGDSQALALTPCKHIFCLSCWSGHIHIGLKGASPILCMDSKCKQELEETLLRSLAPGYMVSNWQQRMQEKEIEKNQTMCWCPNTRCDKVAVIEENSAKVNQFGSLVICDCNTSWCFSCQKEPHWPASCDQAEAVRKLALKAGADSSIPISHTDFFIELKRCPGCRYPIEKSEGCPSMVCRMCWLNFCWNCLRPVDHNVYSCRARTDNFITYNLQNKLISNIPIKFFPKFMQIRKKVIEMEKNSAKFIIPTFQFSKHKFLKYSRNIVASLNYKNEMNAEDVKSIALATFNFIREIYVVLQSFYILLSFVHLRKDKPSAQSFTSSAKSLEFIAYRLEERILNKKLSELYKNSNTVEELVVIGRKHLRTLKTSVKFMQDLTKDIDTHEIGNLDPKSFMRFM